MRFHPRPAGDLFSPCINHHARPRPQNVKMYPAGRILWLPAAMSGDNTVLLAGEPRWASPEAFCELVLSSSMLAVRRRARAQGGGCAVKKKTGLAQNMLSPQ